MQQQQVKLIPLFMEKIGNCIRFLEQSSFGRTQENKTKLVQAVRWLFPDPNSPARLIQMLSIVCTSRNTRDPALLLQFITAQLGLDLMQFSKEEQDKFKRYIECFLDLSQQCSDLMKEMPVQAPITLAASSTLPSSQPSAGSKREPSSIEAPSLPAPLPPAPPATDSQSVFVVPVKLEPPSDYKSNPQGASRRVQEEVVLPILDCSPSSVDPSTLLLSPAYDSDARDYFPAPPRRQDQPSPTSQKQGSQAVVVDLTTKQHEGPEKTIVKKEKKKTGPKGPHKKKLEQQDKPSASPSLPPVPQESKPVESPAALPPVPPH